MVLERLTTTEVDLRGFKLIPHELHHDSILTRSSYNGAAIARRSEEVLIKVYNVESSAYAIMLLLRSRHMSAIKIIEKWAQETTLGDTSTNCGKCTIKAVDSNTLLSI